MDDEDRQTTHRKPLQPGTGQQRCLGGRFVLLDQLGSGGGAVVVRARDLQFPRKLVAIKLLRSRDEDLRRRFVQEAEVLADVAHPAIVQVLGHDLDGDELYTVLELIEGPDLFEHLAVSGPLPWRRVVEIGVQIASALDVVHRRGLVHRDVKPANIMLDGAGRVKLIDFNVVSITENYRVPTGAMARRPTEMGKALGTPGYLPLEAGLVAPNPSFDVFGLGATLYQLLTGRVPEEPIAALHEAHPGGDVPPDLELVLIAALALEPEDRTQTAAELGRALEAVRAAHPERGVPSTRIDGRYEVIGLAGTGAKADAKVAVHRGSGHDVVLKCLRADAPEELLRFTREAKILSTFTHPAMPRFYDYAPESKPPYIAMARAPGQPAARLCSPPRLRPAEVAAVGVKLAQVLAVVHARGVLHRDLNASNVLIDSNGAVTLLDFGSAELGEKFYDAPAGERRYMTPPEARVAIPDGGIGQFAWSAPEVSAGKAWSDRCDVYSMGHLLFRLMTGKVPVKGADPPSSPLDFVVTCPEAIAKAIERALDVNPQARPSAAQFAQLLIDAIEDDEEVFARAVAAATPVGRPALRLVPTGPEAHADWTEHPIPDTSSEPPVMAMLAEPQAVAPPPAPIRGHARIVPATVATVALAALVVAAWGMQRPAPEVRPPDPQRPTPEVRPPDPQSPATATPATRRSTPAPITSAPTLGTMRDALDDATPALRRCSLQSRGLLFVNFTTTENGEMFAVSVPGGASEAVTRCVSDATANLRFLPHARAETFTEEYTP